MAQQIRPTADVNGQPFAPVPAMTDGPPATEAEPSLGVLFRELAQESSTLIRQEIRLAKAEIRENARDVGKDLGMIAAGAGALLLAMLVFTAFLIAGLGELLGGEYWLSALIVGVLYAGVGGVMLARGRSGLSRNELRPEHTIRSLQEDRQWAKAEANQVKQDLRA